MAKTNCSKCRNPLPQTLLNAPGLGECPHCNAKVRVWAFPALVKPPEAPPKDDGFKFEDDAACFYHPKKRAVVPCSWCGRFLCSLCDVEFNNDHVCPTCLETASTNHNVELLETQQTLYDYLALSLAYWPLLFVITAYLTIFTAPAALFVVFRYFKTPITVLPRTRIRYVIAGLLATLQVAGWVGLFVYLAI